MRDKDTRLLPGEVGRQGVWICFQSCCFTEAHEPCNPADERRSRLLPVLVAALVASIISSLRLKRRPASSSCAVPGSKLLAALCQRFVARKTAADERNPHLAAGAVCPSLSRTSFTVTVSTTIYFPWSLCCDFIICCLLQGWQWCGRAAAGVLSGV